MYISTIRLLRASNPDFVDASVKSGTFSATLRSLTHIVPASRESTLAVLTDANNLEELLERVPYIESVLIALSWGVSQDDPFFRTLSMRIPVVKTAVDQLKVSPPLLLLISTEQSVDELQRQANVEELIRRDLQLKSVALYANWRGSDYYFFGVPHLPARWPVSTFCGRKVLGCAASDALEVPVPVLRIFGSQDKFVAVPEEVALLRSFADVRLPHHRSRPQENTNVRLTDLVHSQLVRLGQEVSFRSGDREWSAQIADKAGEAFLRDSDGSLLSVEDFVRRYSPSSATPSADPWKCVSVTKRSSRNLADLRSEFIRRRIGKELYTYVPPSSNCKRARVSHPHPSQCPRCLARAKPHSQRCAQVSHEDRHQRHRERRGAEAPLRCDAARRVDYS